MRGSEISSSPLKVEKRKSPDEEFFMMTLLAFKIRNQELDKVIQLDSKKLFKEVLKLKKAFFDFPRWIEEEANKQFLNYKYGKMNKAKKMLGKKDEEVVSNQMTSPFVIRDTYFN